MTETKLSRREFFERAMLLGTMVAGAGVVLAACGPPKRDGVQAATPGGEQKTEAAPVCDDNAGVSDADKQQRTALKYVSQTPDPAKNCVNCSLYTPPVAGAACGGCKVLKGPIQPNGYCMTWQAKAG